MPNYNSILKDLKEFRKNADGWSNVNIPIGNNCSVCCLPETKTKGKRLALVRNPNKKRKGVFNFSMEEYMTELEDNEANSENYLLILKAIEEINGTTKPPEKETTFDWS